MAEETESLEIDLTTMEGDWELDPAASSAAFTARGMWGLLPVSGSFRKVTGTVEVRSGSGVRGRVEIDASSIDTGMSARDKHLTGKDFLATSAHPTIAFTITGVTPNSPNPTLSGELKIRDVATPLESKPILRFDGTAVVARVSTKILLSTYAIRAPFGMVRPEVALDLVARFTRNQPR